MAIGVGSWYLVTARSDQLIAAIRHESVVSELIRFDTNTLLDAALGACLRARFLIDQGDALLMNRQSHHQLSDITEIRSSPDPNKDVA